MGQDGAECEHEGVHEFRPPVKILHDRMADFGRFCYGLEAAKTIVTTRSIRP